MWRVCVHFPWMSMQRNRESSICKLGWTHSGFTSKLSLETLGSLLKSANILSPLFQTKFCYIGTLEGQYSCGAMYHGSFQNQMLKAEMCREQSRSGEFRTAKAFITVRAMENEVSERVAAHSDCSDCPHA